MVYIEFPEVGSEIDQNSELGEIESTKAVSVIYAPVSCSVLENNTGLEEDYSKINDDAESTWIFKVKINDEGELSSLMTEEEY